MSLRSILVAAPVLAVLGAARPAAACPAYDECVNHAYAGYGELTQRAEEHFTECIHDPAKKYEDCERARDDNWSLAWQILDYDLAECHRDYDRLCPAPMCGPGGYGDYCSGDPDCGCSFWCMEYCYYDPDWGYIGCCV